MWCAASSTGEEPYTIAFTTEQVCTSRPNIDWRLLATDISTRVLRKASDGVYSESALEAVPEAVRRRNLIKAPTPNGETEPHFRVRDDLRSRILFRRMNLAKPPFPMRGPLDVVFCRNVMIYFDEPVRRALVAEFRRLLKPGGLLIVGMSEGLVGCDDGFARRGASTYEKVS
jgi:chemotaxis protein methyltransferase CheR